MIRDIILGVLRVFLSYLCVLMTPHTLVSELCMAHGCCSFLSHVRLFVTLGTAACQASLSFTVSKEFAQTHVHRVGDAIQPSHSLLSPYPPAFNLSQHQGLFQ